ncbi:hypothetical protein CIK05_02605 [Bdellovibrio sp. qaytius]|nr:hypothetical protein CIK05_02605 [Bdellovibrio sp. qaytius]
MKSFAKLFCVFLFVGANAHAQAPTPKATTPVPPASECPYDFANSKSALDQKSKNYSSIQKEVRNDKILTHKAILKKDGVKVEFISGGCAHYSYSFAYTNLKQTNFTADQAFKRVLELLKATPTTPAGKALAKTLIEALHTASMNKIFRPPNSSYEVPCGDAQCTLDATVKGQLKAAYTFAL